MLCPSPTRPLTGSRGFGGTVDVEGLLYIFFLTKEKKRKRNRDFVSGNPLPQQLRIQLAPAAAGLGGDLADPESSGGSGPWGCLAFQWWVSESGSIRQGRQGTGAEPRGLRRAWPPVLAGRAGQCSWLLLITCSLNFSDPILAEVLRLAPVLALRPVPVSGAGLPAWALLKDPQSFASMFYPLELALVLAVEGTLGQLHTSLIPLSHLCPSPPMLEAFPPGPYPISYLLISFNFI